MNNLIFKNVIVEVFVLNGIPYFNPYHVGVCLGLSESAVRMALSKMTYKQVVKLTNSDVKDTDIRKLNNAGENFLTESGVYKLIFRSNKEQAEEFQNWVTDDVLPQIRQTGMYISEKDKLHLQLFSDDKLVVVKAHKELIELETAPLVKQLEEQAPQVTLANAITSSSGSILVGEVANILKQNGINTGEKRFYQWLRDNGYIKKANRSDKNMPTAKAMKLGVLEIKEGTRPTSYGNKLTKTTVVTPKGQEYFLNKFLSKGAC